MARSHFEGTGVDGQQVRVLVVDDDALVRRAVRLTCESEGYTVQEAERASEALARLETFHPDVVVLDLVLPDLSGFDVCREIRRAGHRMPVIILSAKHDEIDVVLGLEIGADDYIAKPFRPRELLARIGAHLRKARELRGEDKPAGRAPRLPGPGHRHGGAARHPRGPGHRAHPHRVRPALLPGVERRQGALPRADPQRGLGLRAPDRDAGHRRPRPQPPAQDRARAGPAPAHPGRARASATDSQGSDADLRR